MGETTASGVTGPSWEIRFTWQSPAGGPDPDCTIETVESETQAIDRAVYVIDRANEIYHRRLLAVHRRRIGTQWWRLVDDG